MKWNLNQGTFIELKDQFQGLLWRRWNSQKQCFSRQSLYSSATVKIKEDRADVQLQNAHPICTIQVQTGGIQYFLEFKPFFKNQKLLEPKKKCLFSQNDFFHL